MIKAVIYILTMLAKAQEGKFGNSLKGYHWIVSSPDLETVSNLCKTFSITEVMAKIMVNREITSIEQAKNFLKPKIKNLMPNPFDLKDMDKASKRLANAVINNEKITIFGDYDVDGITSTSLMRRFFRDLGLDVGIYIPNRIQEGYGPNLEALKKLKDEGNSIVVTVDCGSTSLNAINGATEHGLDIIVVDHHIGGEEMPNAYAIVNPNRLDEDFECKSIAAVGVSFLVAVAVRSQLRGLKWFEYNQEPNLMQYMDLVALGTVCDVIHLSNINRAFVEQGIKVMKCKENVGLAALLDATSIGDNIQSYHLGYVLGPRINAGGRIGHGILGARLLSTEDASEAKTIVQQLDELNERRKGIEKEIFDQVIAKIEDSKMHKEDVIMVHCKDWHQGILGILASRIKERYQRPSIIISIQDGVGKGSARSIEGVNLGDLFSQAKQDGILLEGGGHAMAGGLCIDESKLDDFYDYIKGHVGSIDTHLDHAKELKIDAIISARAVSIYLAKEIEQGAPFGNGNHQPRFMLSNAIVTMIRVVGGSHIMLIARDANDTTQKNTVKCMFFRALNSKVGHFLVKEGVGKNCNIVGFIQVNMLDSKKVDFIIEDISVIE